MDPWNKGRNGRQRFSKPPAGMHTANLHWLASSVSDHAPSRMSFFCHRLVNDGTLLSLSRGYSRQLLVAASKMTLMSSIVSWTSIKTSSNGSSAGQANTHSSRIVLTKSISNRSLVCSSSARDLYPLAFQLMLPIARYEMFSVLSTSIPLRTH